MELLDIKIDDSSVTFGLQKLQRKVSGDSQRRILQYLGETVRGKIVQNKLSGRPGLKRKTGTLAKSISWELVGTNAVQIGSNVTYAAIHEFGGVIKPRDKKYLRFKTEDGKWITTKRVTIPARPYFRPEIQDLFTSGTATTIFNEVLNEDIQEVFR